MIHLHRHVYRPPATGGLWLILAWVLVLHVAALCVMAWVAVLAYVAVCDLLAAFMVSVAGRRPVRPAMYLTRLTLGRR